MVKKLYNLIYDCTSEEEEMALIKAFLEQEDITPEQLLKISTKDREWATGAFKERIIDVEEFYKITTDSWIVEDYYNENCRLKSFKEVINTIQPNETYTDTFEQDIISMDSEGYLSIDIKGLSIDPNQKVFRRN